MEGPVSFWGYKEQESNLILPEHDDDDDDDDKEALKHFANSKKNVKKLLSFYEFEVPVFVPHNLINHYPANVENMVSS
jgi:hypothetical protein